MRALAIVTVLCGPAIAHATAYDIHAGDDLYARLAALQAGDTVVVHAGTFTTPGFYEVTWPGTAGSPIAITAAPGEHVRSGQRHVGTSHGTWARTVLTSQRVLESQTRGQP